MKEDGGKLREMKVYECIRRDMRANESRWSQMRTNIKGEEGKWRQIKEIEGRWPNGIIFKNQMKANEERYEGK